MRSEQSNHYCLQIHCCSLPLGKQAQSVFQGSCSSKRSSPRQLQRSPDLWTLRLCRYLRRRESTEVLDHHRLSGTEDWTDSLSCSGRSRKANQRCDTIRKIITLQLIVFGGIGRNSSEEWEWLLSSIILSLKKELCFFFFKVLVLPSGFASSSILLVLRKTNLKNSEMVLLIDSVSIIAITLKWRNTFFFYLYLLSILY